MIEPTATIALGTAFYIVVLWVALRHPRATGMMLTFPTLNGIGLLMAEPAALEQAAHAMLLMPVLNACLCAGYLVGFDRLVRAGVAPVTASGTLIAAIAILWLTLAWLITREHWGVPSRHQLAYAIAVAGAGLVLTLVLWPARAVVPPATAAQPFGALLHRNRKRIAVFAVSLAAVAIAERLEGTPAMLGVLASLPLVALFGMHAIASDHATPLESRQGVLAAMASGVWIGPVIAIAFVAGFWRVLTVLAGHGHGAGYLLAGAVALSIGWSLCIVAIGACTGLMSRLRPTRTPRARSLRTPTRTP